VTVALILKRIHPQGFTGGKLKMGRKNKKKPCKQRPSSQPADPLAEVPRHLRPASALEESLAKQIIAQRGQAQVLKEIEAQREVVDVPTVDVHNVVTQMQLERSRSPIGRGTGTYVELTRYGLFLKSAREKLAEEIPKANHRLRLATALCDRTFQKQIELDQKRADVERANRNVAWLTEAVGMLNSYLSELQRAPQFVQAMAELRARDMVQPCWDQSFSPAERGDDEDYIEDDLSFEELLKVEKAELERKSAGGQSDGPHTPASTPATAAQISPGVMEEPEGTPVCGSDGENVKDGDRGSKTCAVCDIRCALRCSRCRKVYYCSREHQKQDLKTHKIHCKKAVEASAAMCSNTTQSCEANIIG